MEGFIPTGGAGSTAKVQEASGNAGVVDSTVTATFPVASASGNLLIAVLSYRGTSTSHSDPSGWTKHSDVQGPAFDGGRLIFYSRISTGQTSVSIGCTAIKKSLYIAEWFDASTFSADAEEDNKAADQDMETALLAPGVSPALLFAGFNASTHNAAPTHTWLAPFSRDYFRVVDSSGPVVSFGHQIVGTVSGSYKAEARNNIAGDGYGAFIAAFQAASGGITWVAAPDTIDEADGTSDDVTTAAITATSGAFWRGISDFASNGTFRAVLGMDDAVEVTVLVQAGDEADWSDAATVLEFVYDATGSFTADEIDATFDAEAHQYWRLVLDSTAQDVRVYEVSFGEAEEHVPQPEGKAILEIYVHDEDASRWGIATWATGPATGTEGIWSGAGWQDVTPQGVNAHIIWGSRRPSRGILAEQSPASWNVQTYDPERILDPGNFDGPFYPQLVAGVPIRISHDSVVIRTGIVDEWHYKLKRPDYQGQILASDTWSPLNQAMVPADSILGNTVWDRIGDAINAAGVAVGGIPLPPFIPVDNPTIADWVEGADTDDPTSVGDHIRIATSEVLWVPFINADAGLGLRSWGAPLDRGRVIAAPNLEDLEAVSHEDGLYSVVKVQVEDPDLAPIIRKAAPLPRYGERVWERREPTIDPEGYAAAILGERPWPGVQWVPGAIHCFTAADVDYFGTIEIMERVTLSVPGAVSVQGRVLGGELFVEHRKQASQGATWLFYFAVATDGSTAIGSTILVADETGETLLDDMTDTDFLEAD